MCSSVHAEPAWSARTAGVTAFSFLCGAVLGFYDGFFGPGTGAFWTIACLSLFGLELTRATAFTKVVNLTSNLASLMVFIITARVNYEIAAAMIAGQLMGGRLGAGMAIKHGAPFIRIIFIIVVFAMAPRNCCGTSLPRADTLRLSRWNRWEIRSAAMGESKSVTTISASPQKRTRRKPKRMGGEAGFGFRRVSFPGGCRSRFPWGGGSSRQQEQLIPIPAIAVSRERVCGFAEGCGMGAYRNSSRPGVIRN